MMDILIFLVTSVAVTVLGALILLSPIILSGLLAFLLPLEGENKTNDKD
jgi:Sec-independent protein secretion pathway component TatC